MWNNPKLLTLFPIHKKVIEKKARQFFHSTVCFTLCIKSERQSERETERDRESIAKIVEIRVEF